MPLLTYIMLGLKAYEILARAQQQGREPSADDEEELKRSDEYRALAEARWQAGLPKNPEA